MKRFEGKIAVITGGNSGIGLGTAKMFVQEGAKVAFIGRDQKTIDSTLEILGSGHLGYKGDVTSQTDLEGFFQAIKEKYGKIDTLFVNAGISKTASIANTSEAFYDEMFNINIKGAFFTVQHALPLMSKGTSIVLTSSIMAHTGMPDSSVYSASKAALRSFTRSFASELLPQGIRVNAVGPGPITTPIMVRNAEDPVAMAAMMEHVTGVIPMRRMGTPEEVAKAVLFLASDDSSFTTGIEIAVDGGMANI